MAGQSDAADDLIAELAKLMAQDAQGDRGAKPAAQSRAPMQFPPVRIPGDVGPKSVSHPPTDFLRSLSPVQSAQRTEPVDAEVVPAPASPVARPEPFDFDFGIGAPSAPRPAPMERPAAAVSAAPRAETGGSDKPSDERDSIADLISAELAAHPEPEPAPVAPMSPPTPAPSVMATSVAHAPVAGQANLGSRDDRDRFKVPPVFGLGSSVAATAAAAPAVQQAPSPSVASPVPVAAAAPAPVASAAAAVDPIEEIESLIGRAMRVEFALPEEESRPVESRPEPVVPPTPRAAPSPALRSLATPVLPNRSADEVSVADQTIFAAAEATGAKLDWVNEPAVTRSAPQEHRAAPRQRRAMGMSRALAGPLVAVTLLLAAGFGLYWVLGLGGRDSGPPPLLTADAAPIKEVAPAAAADSDTAAQSVVFNEISGGTPSADEQLVSRDQTDVNEVTQVAAAPADLGEDGLANRKVRTVKVRPDGTIVSGDESVAGSAILPVDRPNLPEVPGASIATPELLASTAPTQPSTPAPAAEALPVAETPVPTVVPVEPGSTVPAVDLTGATIAGKSATIPLTRPTGLRLASAAPAAADTSAAPALALAPTAESAPLPAVAGATEVAALGDTAPAYVQLASQRSEADARQSAQNMVTRYGPLFGGANLEVQRVDLGTRGIYYRVRVPASSLEQANVICTNVKAAGGDCFTM